MRLLLRLVEPPDPGRDAGDTDRDVYEEDPAPADVRRERAADERPDRDRHPHRRAPDPERRSALAAVELLGDDCERDGEHPRASDSLRAAGEDQPERGV